MSGIDAQLQRALQDLSFKAGEIFPATVKAVNKKNKSLSVTDFEGLGYPDVRLTATLIHEYKKENEEDRGDKLTVYPSVESSVLVAKIGGSSNTLVCVAYSKIDALEAKIGGTSFFVDEKGFQIQRGGKNLYSTLEKLFQEVQKLCEELAKVFVSVGTTVDRPAVDQIKKNLDNIKEELNQILK